MGRISDFAQRFSDNYNAIEKAKREQFNKPWKNIKKAHRAIHWATTIGETQGLLQDLQTYDKITNKTNHQQTTYGSKSIFYNNINEAINNITPITNNYPSSQAIPKTQIEDLKSNLNAILLSINPTKTTSTEQIDKNTPNDRVYYYQKLKKNYDRLFDPETGYLSSQIPKYSKSDDPYLTNDVVKNIFKEIGNLLLGILYIIAPPQSNNNYIISKAFMQTTKETWGEHKNSSQNDLTKTTPESSNIPNQGQTGGANTEVLTQDSPTTTENDKNEPPKSNNN